MINKDNFRIAIPSYNRYDELRFKTLKTLEEINFPKNRIDIFLTEDEIQTYKNLIYNDEYTLIKAPKGMKAVREFIFLEYYNEGDYIVSMDDDITGFKMKNPRGWEESCFCDDELDLVKEIKLAFEECEKSKRHLWGINCMDSHFYMKNTITYDFKFCIGHFWGCIVNKECLSLGTDQYEDYERTIKHYLKDGGVVRLNYICAKTKYIAKGGMGKEREFNKSLDYLLNTYKDLVSIKKKKNGDNPLLKDKRILEEDNNKYDLDTNNKEDY
jgi:hypothetical protein